MSRSLKPRVRPRFFYTYTNPTMLDDYFKHPNHQSAYWAGFIGADGNINQDLKRLEIELHSDDKHHLEQFKQDLELDVTVSDRTRTKKSGFKSSTSRIQISSAELVGGLVQQFNLKPKKSLDLEPPVLLGNDDAFCYIIGYIDGNGSINQRTNTTTVSLSVTTGSISIADWMTQALNILCKTSFPKINVVKKDKSYVYVFLYEHGDCIKIAKKLQGYKIPCLQRKWGKIILPESTTG